MEEYDVKKEKFIKMGVAAALIGVVGSTGGDLGSAIVAKASSNLESNALIGSNVVNISDYNLSPLRGLIDKGVLNEFSFNDKEELVLKIEKETITLKYNLNNEEKVLLDQIIKNVQYLNAGNPNNSATDNASGHEKIFIKNWKIYFNHGETVSLLASAAAAGPAALYVAFVGLSSMIGGPIGTVISLLGGLSLAQAASYISKACATGKGYYIGLDMSGFIPGITQGIW